MSFENSESVVAELVQFTENDGDIYRQTTQPILKNLATKKAQGKYDHDKAVQAFMYLAEAGARKYAQDFDPHGAAWHEMFPMEIRRAAAARWRDEFEEEFNLGNYDSLMPKKYQGSQKPVAPAYHVHEIGDDVWWWGSQGTKVIGTVVKIHFVGERPDYEVKIHGAGSVVMKAEHELASETGRKKLAAQTRSADRRKKPRTCPDCGGSGSRSTARSASGHELSRHAKYGTRCPRCGGAGTLS